MAPGIGPVENARAVARTSLLVAATPLRSAPKTTENESKTRVGIKRWTTATRKQAKKKPGGPLPSRTDQPQKVLRRDRYTHNKN